MGESSSTSTGAPVLGHDLPLLDQWDPSTAAVGPHTITASGYDLAGNLTSVSVQVSYAPPPPSTGPFTNEFSAGQSLNTACLEPVASGGGQCGSRRRRPWPRPVGQLSVPELPQRSTQAGPVELRSPLPSHRHRRRLEPGAVVDERLAHAEHGPACAKPRRQLRQERNHPRVPAHPGRHGRVAPLLQLGQRHVGDRAREVQPAAQHRLHREVRDQLVGPVPLRDLRPGPAPRS